MARFICPEHGEVDSVTHSGYSLGHRTGRDGPNELDLEGIYFTFDVVENDTDDLELELVDADGARNYLSKFADWEEKVTEAAEGEFEHTCGEDGCNQMLYWLEDDEPLPDEVDSKGELL